MGRFAGCHQRKQSTKYSSSVPASQLLQTALFFTAHDYTGNELTYDLRVKASFDDGRQRFTWWDTW